MSLSSKDLLGIKGMSPEEIRLVLDTAASFKDVSERDIKKVPALREDGDKPFLRAEHQNENIL